MNFDAHPRSSLIVALDFDSLTTAVKFAKQVADLVGMFKIGSQLFTSAGPEAVRQVAQLGTGIFLDLKFHDIPNTVAGAVLASAAMPGVQLVNVHALGGTADDARSGAGGQRRRADGRGPHATAGGHNIDEHGPEGDAGSRNWRCAARRAW